MKLALLPEVERAAELFSLCPIEAEAAAEVVEPVVAAGTERRTREDDGRNPVVQLFLQGRADVDRGAGEGDPRPAGLADVHPVNLSGQVLGEPLLRRQGEGRQPVRPAREFDLFFLGVERLRKLDEVPGEPDQVFAETVLYRVRFPPPAGAPPRPGQPDVD